MAAVAVGAAMTATAADATLYKFDLTGSRNATFTINSARPSFSSPYQTQFRDVSGFYNGIRGLASTVSFGAVFFISSLDIAHTPLGFAQFGGPILFTGPTSAPVFTIGTFALSGIVSGNSSLKIALAPVPEPSAWMVMLGGLGMMGGALRLRGKRAL